MQWKTSIRLHACSRDPITYSREHDHKRSAIPKQQILYAVMAKEGPLRGHDRIFPGSASTRWAVGNLAEIAPRDLTSLDQESETPTLEYLIKPVILLAALVLMGWAVMKQAQSCHCEFGPPVCFFDHASGYACMCACTRTRYRTLSQLGVVSLLLLQCNLLLIFSLHTVDSGGIGGNKTPSRPGKNLPIGTPYSPSAPSRAC